MHKDNKSTPTAPAYPCELKACTGAAARRTQLNAGERRPPVDALAQVLYKNTADMKECWHKRIHSRMCIIITDSPGNPNGTTKTLGIPACVDNRTYQPHKFTNTSSKPVLVQLHKRAQQKATDRRPLTDAPVKVPHKKNPAGTEERRDR